LNEKNLPAQKNEMRTKESVRVRESSMKARKHENSREMSPKCTGDEMREERLKFEEPRMIIITIIKTFKKKKKKKNLL
jgi:hypothetical protein